MNNSSAGGSPPAWEKLIQNSANIGQWVYMTGNNPGYLYRCKITDSYGNVVYSEPGEIKVAADTWEFTYDADGLRTSRTNGYTTYEYVYHGSQLSQMTVGDDVLKFGYDASGTPLYVIWNSSKYFYTTNLQGDVVAIVSANGNPVVYYSYDAWGNILSVTGTRADNLGKLNPLRYRGYVYDQETGLYYLQSRYYNPEWGRFLNADSFVSTGQGILGNNMFAYCGNNPVIRKDDTGTVYVFLDEFMAEVDPDGRFDEGGGGGGWGLGVNTSYYTSQRIQSYDWNWQNSPYNQNPTGPTGTSSCFVAGTLVQTDDGTKPIEEIEVGDCVWAWDEETGDVALKEVAETYINETTELIHVFVNGEEIITTPMHPFYSPVKGWTDAAQLRAGDILVLVDGEYVVVEKVQHELLEAPITVYNFQVEGYHTYYVSNAGVLVHNNCKQQMVAGSKDGYNAKVSVGGEANHPNSPHAHIFWKNNKLASVDEQGNIVVGSLDKRGRNFVSDSLAQIVRGIVEWWFYGK